MAKNESTKTKSGSEFKPKGEAPAKRKGETRTKRKDAPRGSRSDLHYVLISKDGTLTVISRETGLVSHIKRADAKAFADLIAERQALGKKLGQILVKRDLNGGAWENCLFIESYK